jgi:hypothetical protein
MRRRRLGLLGIPLVLALAACGSARPRVALVITYDRDGELGTLRFTPREPAS